MHGSLQFKAPQSNLQVICNSRQFKPTILQVRVVHWPTTGANQLWSISSNASLLQGTWNKSILCSGKTIPSQWTSWGTSWQSHFGFLITWLVIIKANCHWQLSSWSFNPLYALSQALALQEGKDCSHFLFTQYYFDEPLSPSFCAWWLLVSFMHDRNECCMTG